MIEIVAKERALAVRMGYVNSVAISYIQPDTVRVVMLPGGNGKVIAAERNFSSLIYAGVTFTKVPK